MKDRELSGSFKEMLSQAGINDPVQISRLQLMANLLNQSNSRSSEEKHSQNRRREEIKRKILRLQEEHRNLSERNNNIAEALGACRLCWGEDSSCDFCRGRGSPGFFPLDEELFEYYITPVLIRMDLVKPEDSLTHKAKGD